jgi:sulfite reductase alpha subunit-like flavoprotein
LDPWLESLWKRLLNLIPLPPGLEPIPLDTLPPPTYKIEFLNYDHPITPQKTNCTIAANIRISTPLHFQDVRHLELDTNLEYQPGDVFCVIPQNTPQKVIEAINHFKWNDICDKKLRVTVNKDFYPGLINLQRYLPPRIFAECHYPSKFVDLEP